MTNAWLKTENATEMSEIFQRCKESYSEPRFCLLKASFANETSDFALCTSNEQFGEFFQESLADFTLKNSGALKKYKYSCRNLFLTSKNVIFTTVFV